MKGIVSAKIDHSVPFVVRVNESTKVRSTWFYADVRMNDERTDLRKVGILIEVAAFAEWLGFECNDPVTEYGEVYLVYPNIIDDGEVIYVEDFLEDHEDKLVKFLADDKQFENQTWVVA